MKRLFLLLLVSFFTAQMMASDLVLIPTKNFEETRSLFKSPSLTINFYRDEFVIATLDGDPKHHFVVLDQNPWQNGLSYYVVYLDKFVDKSAYYALINPVADVLYDGGSMIVVRIDEVTHGQLLPAKNDGMVRLSNNQVVLPNKLFYNESGRFDPDPFVVSLLNEVNGTNITSVVQHLENYTTRNCYKPQSILAQNWIKDQFESMGLSVELMDFTMPNGPASDNVIATKIGTKYPDEFVILGGHYDSLTWSGAEPGADDNASGTSGVMEVARILSEYEFDRTIIFCAFSGEEYGLYGSAAYASRCAQQGMDILGYFNMDMIGYLEPGNTTIMTSLIYPQSAQELATFYTNVTATYLPDFVVSPGNLTGGDSDHTSFNNNGFMGIFPFEDVNNYSPYIHTSNDLVGPSFNNENQAAIFTKAILASVVTMANMQFPPRNLVALPGDGKVDLMWDTMFDIDFYKIYRDGAVIDTSYVNSFTDFEVENGTQYEYYVTAIYTDSGEESIPSNVVLVTPMPPIGLPLMINFENGAPYWENQGSWGLSSSVSYSPSHSLTESPTGNYVNDLDIAATLSPLNLMGYTAAEVSFWTKYDIETNWDYMYLEVTTNGSNWANLATYTGTQSNWQKKTYSLNNYINNPYVVLRFRFYSDGYIVKDGMYIDDFEITVEGGYNTQLVQIPGGWSGISSYVLPAQSQLENMMQPILNDLVILQSIDEVYWPAQNINTIGNWDTHAGYKVKVSNDVGLQVTGVLEQSKTINLDQGWNILPVLSDCPVSCADLFANVSSQVVMVKDIAATGVYWPAQSILSLDELIPGKAYYVLSNASVSITFPACTKAGIAKKENLKSGNDLWDLTAPTGNSHIISIPAYTLQNFAIGDYIGVFTPSGLCAGCLEIDDLITNKAMVVFANDSTTSVTDGFMMNESFHFKLYETVSGEEYNLLASYDNSLPNTSYFSNEGASGLTELVIDNTGITEQQGAMGIFPNPSKGHVMIRLMEGSNAILEVMSLTGQLILIEPLEGEAFINTASLPKGVYTFHIHGEGFSEIHKVIIH
ncbi:MAG: M28 family peptidase [Bacteroidales bacterium]|nr:M28 family peptidase [Bacteroidales bacterium]